MVMSDMLMRVCGVRLGGPVSQERLAGLAGAGWAGRWRALVSKHNPH